MREEEMALASRRLDELASRSGRTDRPCFSGFLSPPGAGSAAGRRPPSGRRGARRSGYEDAERRVACFLPDGEEEAVFPITALELTWPGQSAPGHRDILGSVLGLGLSRSCIGDIAVLADRAYVFVESRMAEHVRNRSSPPGVCA